MRLPTQSRRGEVGFNMTPMIDVVFQLIIFFLLTSHLTKQEAHLPLPLPGADSAGESADDESPRVTLNVRRDGELTLAGRPIARAELPVRLRERAAQVGGDLEVRIRGDRGVEYRQIGPLLKACAEAGVWNVTFAVLKREDMR